MNITFHFPKWKISFYFQILIKKLFVIMDKNYEECVVLFLFLRIRQLVLYIRE